MLSQSEQRRILREDRKRRQERELIELAELTGIVIPTTQDERKPYAHVNPELVRGIGVVSPPPKVRASERWTGTLGTSAHRSGRTIGVAPGTESKTPTVAVTRGGITEIVPASRFGSTRNTKVSRTVTHKQAMVPEVARIQQDTRDIRAIADGTA